MDAMKRDRFETHRATVREGVSIAYNRAGTGGVPLLLLHGWPGSKRLFWRNIEPLSRAGFDVIVPDQRGFGDSVALESGLLDPASSARDMAALLEMLGHTKGVVVCAGDQGSVVAMDMSLRFPDLVQRMVLFNGGLPALPEIYAAAGLPENQLAEIAQVSDHMSLHGNDADTLCAELDTDTKRRDYVKSFFTGHVWRVGEEVRALAGPGNFSDAEADFQAEVFEDADVLRTSLGMYEAFAGAKPLSEPPMLDRHIEAETMILYGMQDEIVGDYWPRALALACRRPVGPFLIQKAGHFVQWEAADILNGAIQCFCRDLLPAPSS